MNNKINTHKLEVFNSALRACDTIVVFIAKQDNVILPESAYAGKAFVVLEYGLDMPKPISDFRTDAKGIYGDLSFNNTPVNTFVPWSAVFTIVDKAEGFASTFPYSAEVAGEFGKDTADKDSVVAEVTSVEQPLKRTPPRGKLSLVN